MASSDAPPLTQIEAPLPSESEFSEMFHTLLGVPVAAENIESNSKTAAYSLSLHVDADGLLVGAVASDITFTSVMAVALAGQSPKEADDAIHKGKVGLDLWDNYREVANVMNVLFAGDHFPRVILHSVQRVDLPIWSRLQHAHFPSTNFQVDVNGHNAGNVTLFSLSTRDDEELIDLLLTTGAEAAAHDMQVVGGKLIRLYDFHKPKGIERAQLNALRSALNIFTKGAAAVMTELLQSPVHVKLIQLHHQGWDDYAATLDTNAFITTFRLEPLASQFVITFSPGLSMKCLDCRLSGSDLPGALRRTLTDLDVALLDPIGKAVVNELASTLSKYIPVRAHIVRHITEKYMMEGVTLSLTWLVAWMTVSIGGSTFDASICFPIVPLQPVLIALADEAAHGTHLPNPEDGAPLDDWVPELEVELSVHFPKIKLHMSDIAALAPGSLIGLGQDPSALLLMSARNRLFATVEPKVAGHKLAATVAEMIEDPEEFIDTY